MANIKEVRIEGTIPFCCDEDEDMCKILANLNTPTIGLKIVYGNQAGFIPSEQGGRTALYNFVIRGDEAVSGGWIEHVVKTVKKIKGTVSKAQYKDIENNGPVVDLLR